MRNSRDTRFRKVEKLLYLYKDCAETSYKKLDKALEKIRNEKYYPIIELHYYQNRTFEEIAEVMQCSRKTIYDNRDKLIKRIVDILYADEIVKEIIGENEK